MKNNTQTAYNYLLKLLSFKDFPKAILINKLISKGYSSLETEEAIEQAISNKVFKEENYIKQQINNHMKKGFSPIYIAMKLEKQGIKINEEDITLFFKENETCASNQIRIILEKKLPFNLNSLPKDKQYKAINKACMYLASKGHTIDINEYFSHLGL